MIHKILTPNATGGKEVKMREKRKRGEVVQSSSKLPHTMKATIM
jgi:hypothetical protein